MLIEVILPNSFFSDLAMQKPKSLFLEAADLDDLYAVFQNKYPSLVNKMWDEEGNIRKNVILVVNDHLINKNEYDILKFPDHTTLEIMTQFAGG